MKVNKQGHRVVFNCTKLEAYLVQEAIQELRDNREAGDWDDSVNGIIIHQMIKASNRIDKFPWKFDIVTRKWI
jgi:hypothetical protein